MNEIQTKLWLSEANNKMCCIDSDLNLNIESKYHKISCFEHDLFDFTSKPEKKNANAEIYSVYRYLFDTKNLIDSKIKFDITVISTNDVYGELPRTRGHYHLKKSVTDEAFFDIYQIHFGSSILQLHDLSDKSNSIYLIEANPGDIICLPPELCHVVYNSGDKPLVFSNWCTRKEHLDYESMINTSGPALNIYNLNDKILSISRNKAFSKTDLPINLLKPLGATEVCANLDVNSKYIYDWQYNSNFVSLLNNPSNVGDWINEMYSSNNRLDYEII